MHRYKITFAYDGSNFAGFQVQPGERTVQQVLERAVNKIAKTTTAANGLRFRTYRRWRSRPRSGRPL